MWDINENCQDWRFTLTKSIKFFCVNGRTKEGAVQGKFLEG